MIHKNEVEKSAQFCNELFQFVLSKEEIKPKVAVVVLIVVATIIGKQHAPSHEELFKLMNKTFQETMLNNEFDYLWED